MRAGLAIAIVLCNCSDSPTNGADPVDAGDATCPEGTPLGVLANKPTFTIAIDTHGPYTFIYDTGAPTSVIDSSLRSEVGTGPFVFEVAGRPLTVPAILDTNIAQTYGVTGADGIIGTDILGSLVVTIDRARGRMWIASTLDEATLAACAHASSQATYADFVLANYLYVTGAIEDAEGWFLVDTGATLGAVEQPIFDALQQRHPRPSLTGFYTQAGVGTFWGQLATIGTLQVGGMSVAGVAARTAPPGILPPSPAGTFLGLLPGPFLRHALVTVDYPSRRLRLAPYTDDALEEPPFAYTIGIGLAEETTTPPHVAVVLPDSAAAASDVAVGDRLLQIHGTDIAAIPLSRRQWSLVTPARGSISVTIEGTSGTRTLTLASEDLLAAPDR